VRGDAVAKTRRGISVIWGDRPHVSTKSLRHPKKTGLDVLDRHQIALAELRTLQEIIARHENHEFRIKGWFVAIIGGLAVAIYSVHVPLDLWEYISVATVAAVSFWLWLLYHRDIVRLATERVSAIENSLRIETTITQLPMAIAYDGPKVAISLRKRFPFRTLIRDLILDEQLFSPFIIAVLYLFLIGLFSPNIGGQLENGPRFGLAALAIVLGFGLVVGLRARNSRGTQASEGETTMKSDSISSGKRPVPSEAPSSRTAARLRRQDLLFSTIRTIIVILVALFVGLPAATIEEEQLFPSLFARAKSPPDSTQSPENRSSSERLKAPSEAGPGPSQPAVIVHNWAPQNGSYPYGAASMPPSAAPAVGMAAITDRSTAGKTVQSVPREPLYAWTQLVDGGNRIVSIIADGSDPCPLVRVGQQSFPLSEKRPHTEAQFPIKLCEVELARDEEAWVLGMHFPPWKGARRILFIGDTGCRVTEYQWQGCNEPDGWPFRRVIAAGMDRDVDLVVHVGDYHYREKPCPDAKSGCNGTPWGDNWQTWEAEFFKPAKPLLETAFWIMARGNHEDCKRAGTGWLHFFEPEVMRNSSVACREYTMPFSVPLTDKERLLILDTAYTGKLYGKDAVNDYCRWRREVSNRLGNSGGSATWLLVHQPLWLADRDPGIGATDDFCDVDSVGKDHYAQPARFLQNKSMEAGVKLVWSGDTHVFESVKPKTTGTTSEPWQMVTGMGGTDLEDGPEFDWLRTRVDKTGYTSTGALYGEEMLVTGMLDHGSLLLTNLEPGRWIAEVYESHGKVRAVCALGVDDPTLQRYLDRKLDDSEKAAVKQYGCFVIARQ